MDDQILHNRIAELEQQLEICREAILTLKSSAGVTTDNRFKLLFTHNRDILLFMDRTSGHILDANAAALREYGYTYEELLALTIHDLRADSTKHITAEQMSRADAEGLLFETVHRRKDGSIFPVEVSSQGATIDQQRTLISVVRNITERKLAEKERQILTEQIEQEKNEAQNHVEELNAIIEAMEDPVMVYDRNGFIYQCNTSATKAHGFDPRHQYRDEAVQYMQIRRPDGSLVERKDLPSSLALNGNPVIREHLEVTNKEGREMTLQVTATPLIVNGVQTGVVAVWHDITDLKRSEKALNQYATELERSNRELQEFAFVASHDLQEPLRKIEAFSDMLLEESANLTDRQSDLLNRLKNSAGRMRSMVAGLLQFSRLSTDAQPFQSVDLNQAILEVLSDLDRCLQLSGGTVEADRLPVIEADPLQIHQLFQNLVGNALKFQPAGGKPYVRVYAEQPDDWSVKIMVKDNGIGFDAEHADQLFQLFRRFVSRRDYEGSGMGLAICRKIVERHGGKISVESHIGQGAIFTVTLPIRQINRDFFPGVF
ncbi:MAG: PAS domain S-box protein [Chloroflexi bacterium]|nr:PAS domain S-box protein [Chloroflexota bacterium]